MSTRQRVLRALDSGPRLRLHLQASLAISGMGANAALQSLCRAGHVQQLGASDGDNTMYAITDAGREDLAREEATA